MAASPWSSEDLARHAERAQFGTTRLRSGYDDEEVDAFLDRIVDTLRGSAAEPLTAHEVEAVTFTTTRLRPGYVEEDVDRLLDTVKQFFREQPAR